MLGLTTVLVLGACGGGSDSDSDTDTDSSEPTSCLSDDGVSPSITELTIDCLAPEMADRILVLEVTATDPQGDFTISTVAGNEFKVYLQANGQELYSSPIACSSDPAGKCSTSIEAPNASVDCGTVEEPNDIIGSYTFTAVIGDDDGNLSPECTAVLK